MKKYLIICATLLMAACSREGMNITKEVVDEVVVEESQATENPSEKVTYIEAKGEKTKASIDDVSAAFTWNFKDKVAVYAGGYKISDELASTYDGQGSATFAFSGSEAFDDADRANFAVFPASLVYDANNNLYTTDVTASSLKVNLPASYTLAQVQGEVAPVPMIATNAPNGGLAFKNICALVRLTVNNISKDANTLKITFPGKKVQGEFTLSAVNPGSSAVVTANTSGADDTITITDLGISAFTSGLVISVPVPTGVASSLEYGDVVVGAYDANNHKIHAISTPIKATAWVPTRLSAKKVTANLPVFTVSNDKKVVFAPGNLQAVLGTENANDNRFWDASSWSFAANQYDAIGNTEVNSLSNPVVNGVVDLYAWIGADKEYADGRKYGIFIIQSSGNGSLTGNTPTSLLFDWGGNDIDSWPADVWHTPSRADWEAVFTGSRSETCFAKAILTISDSPKTTVNGVIIIPDQYAHPLNDAFSNVSVANASFSSNSISLADWAKLEKAGCVFLPATGQRKYSSGLIVDNASSELWYWSTTSKTSGGQVYAWKITDTSSAISGLNRQYSCAVRLVRDVN